MALMWAGCTCHPGPFAPIAAGSVGLPHRGVLTDAAMLEPTGPGFVRLRSDALGYGTPSLVHTIREACGQVGDAQSPCVVADMSARFGGALLPKHASHRTGRDVDILYFVTDIAGRPIRSPGFVRFEKHGLAKDAAGTWVRFDAARNWALVRALTMAEDARVEWIFVHPVIRDWLLKYAFEHHESKDTMSRAQLVLGLAGGPKAPHDDHMHVRVACTQAEVLTGCVASATVRDWVHTAPSPLSLMQEDPLLAEELLAPAAALSAVAQAHDE